MAPACHVLHGSNMAVPFTDEFRDGFLLRNPANLAVLAAASRLLPPPLVRSPPRRRQ